MGNTTNNKAICFYFQVHQPFRLKRYRFFNLGIDHYYYDDFTNESIMRRVAERCYLPANEKILSLLNKHKGKFKVAFSISGTAINQFRLYAPEVLDSFKRLADTGMVEFLAETSAHSLASLKNKDEFINQVAKHVEMTKEYFGVEPTTFRNTELIYSDQIGSWVADMGFKAMLTEGAKHILGWKSPNFLYCNGLNPRLKVLLRNFVLSDDIAFKFANRGWSEWPLTADKYASWIKKLAAKSELLNIFIDYETFGEHNRKETGVLDFLEHLPSAILKNTPFKFMTPSEVADTLQPVSAINVNNPISWSDEERDVTAWMGNEMQVAAIEKLYSLTDKVNDCHDEYIRKNWKYLQESDHFYYMSTKFFSDGIVHKYFNPYESPYDAFLNYMNVLSDFEIQLNRMLPAKDTQGKIDRLEWELKVKEGKINLLTKELELLKKKPVKRKTAASHTATAKTASSAKTKATAKTADSAKAEAAAKTKATAKTASSTKAEAIAKATAKTAAKTASSPKTKPPVKKSGK